MRPNYMRRLGPTVLGLALVFHTPVARAAAEVSKKMPVVAKWDRFEATLRSDVKYIDPFAGVDLEVRFTPPTGEPVTVRGFWDGGLNWRVRFAPDLPGVWKYSTTCSDTNNDGLHGQSGEFLCTAASNKTRFGTHGPVGRARRGLYFAHQDGTPFLWLADTVWQGASLSPPEDWTYYAGARASQGFTVAQWVAVPGTDWTQETAFEEGDPTKINPAYFQRLDKKVDTLNRAGLLSAIAPLWNLEAEARHPLDTMSEEQAVRLLRYMLARWGADHVAWILQCEADGFGERPMQWQRIAGAVFGKGNTSTVILHPGETYWAAKDLRTESWVDAIGYQSGQTLTDDSLQWLLSGPFTQEWRGPSPHPVLNLAPAYENGLTDQTGERVTEDEIRRVLYWSLLTAPTAGVSYGAHGVWNWNMVQEPTDDPSEASNLPVWKKALFMPAARQVKHLADTFEEFEWWRLRPDPKVVFNQPGFKSPKRFIAVSRSEKGDLTVAYLPEDRTLEIATEALPPSPKINWFNPRTGKTSPAVAVIGGRSCQFPTPEPGDWLLLMKSQK